MNRNNNYYRMYKAVNSIEELLDEEGAERAPGNSSLRGGGSVGSASLRGGAPNTGSGSGNGLRQGSRPFRPGRDYYSSGSSSTNDEDDDEESAQAVSVPAEEEAGGEDMPYPQPRHRARPLRGRNNRESAYPTRSPRPRKRLGDRSGVKPVGAFAGLCLGLVLWYLGGLCFSFTATSFKLTALKPALFNYWPWLLYRVISYVQVVYLPRSLRDLRVLPCYILVGVIALTAVDISGSSGGALEFWAGKNFRWGSYSFGFQITDAHTIVLSLLCGGVISLGAESVTRFFWGELVEL